MNMLNEEILIAIDNIDDCVMEAETSVINAYIDFYRKDFVQECYRYTYSQNDTIYSESVGSIVKSGVTKFIGLIKKALSFISGLIERIVMFVKNSIKGKKEVMNVNNILLSDPSIELSINEANTSSGGKLFLIDVKGNIINVRLNPFSSSKMIKIDNINRTNYGSPSQSANQGYDVAAISALRDPSLFDALFSLVQCIENVDGKLSLNSKDMPNLIKKYSDGFGHANNTTLQDFESQKQVQLKLDKIQALNKKISVIQKHVDGLLHLKMDDYEDMAGMVKNGSNFLENPRYVIMFVTQELLNFNMALNHLYQYMKDSYILLPELHGRIKDMEQLDLFVLRMLKSGYPSRYIMDNVNVVISKQYFTKSDYVLKTGATRVVIVPENKQVVYKCAYNSAGRSANKNEYIMYKKFNALGGGHFLAKVFGMGKYGCVLKQEYCESVSISQDRIKSLYNEIHEFTGKHNNVRFIADEKPDAVGRHMDNGELCVRDYGLVSTVASYVET